MAAKSTAKKNTVAKETGADNDQRDEAYKERFIDKLNSGDTVFPEDMVRWIADKLGVADDTPFGSKDEAPSRTAGSVATAGIPVDPNKVSDAKKDALKDQAKKTDDDNATALQKAQGRAAAKVLEGAK